MFKRGMSLSEALQCVRMKRPMISPNYGFKLQLQEYERFLQGAGHSLSLSPKIVTDRNIILVKNEAGKYTDI